MCNASRHGGRYTEPREGHTKGILRIGETLIAGIGLLLFLSPPVNPPDLLLIEAEDSFVCALPFLFQLRSWRSTGPLAPTFPSLDLSENNLTLIRKNLRHESSERRR